MRLTTKGRFAVMAMVDLAQHGGKGPVTLASISERQKISLSYLEQLFGKLRKHNIVESVRGQAEVITWGVKVQRFQLPTSLWQWTSRWMQPSAAAWATAMRSSNA